MAACSRTSSLRLSRRNTGPPYVTTDQWETPCRSPVYNGSLSTSERFQLKTADRGSVKTAANVMEFYMSLQPYERYDLINTGRLFPPGKPAFQSHAVESDLSAFSWFTPRELYTPYPDSFTYGRQPPTALYTHTRRRQLPAALDSRARHYPQQTPLYARVPEQQPLMETDTHHCEQEPHSYRRWRLHMRSRLSADRGSFKPYCSSLRHPPTAPDARAHVIPGTTGSTCTEDSSLRTCHVTTPLPPTPVSAATETRPLTQRFELETTQESGSCELSEVLDLLHSSSIYAHDAILKVQTLEVSTRLELASLATVIHERAITDHDSGSTLASLCDAFTHTTAKVSGEDQRTFRFLLERLCQKLFHEGPVDCGWTGYKSSGQDVREARNLHRHKFLGNVRFVGHLYLSGVMTESILHDCIDRLFKNRSAESVVCICQLLTVAGARLMEGARGKDVNIYLCKLQKLRGPGLMEEVSGLLALRKHG